jgi:aldose 1-epimerase
MFLIIEEAVGTLYQLKLLNTRTGEYATVLPDFGGNVNELVLARAGGALLSVIDGYRTADDAQQNAGYKSSKLIPFPNRLRDGKYTLDGKTHQLAITRPQEGHAIHGLWHSTAYEVTKIKANDQKAVVRLALNYKGIEAGYPFSCRVALKYKLTDSGFSCTTEVTNTGKQKLPFGDGWHPYFRLDTPTIDELHLTLPPVRNLPIDARKLPTGNAVSYLDFFAANRIDSTNLDHAFRILLEGGKATVILENKTTDTQLTVWQNCGNKHYDYLQLYTPADRRTLAIEPMTCAPDAFNNEMGLLLIAPKSTWQSKYGVSLR